MPEYYEFGMTAKPADSDTRISCLADSGAFVAYSGRCTGYLQYLHIDEYLRQNHLLMIQSDRNKSVGET